MKKEGPVFPSFKIERDVDALNGGTKVIIELTLTKEEILAIGSCVEDYYAESFVWKCLQELGATDFELFEYQVCEIASAYRRLVDEGYDKDCAIDVAIAEAHAETERLLELQNAGKE